MRGFEITKKTSKTLEKINKSSYPNENSLFKLYLRNQNI